MKFRNERTHQGLILILTAILTVLLSVAVLAEEEHGAVIDSGQCGDTAYWTLYEDGLLEISGEGEMWDYEAFRNFAPWYEYRSDVFAISIGNRITRIGDCAFWECFDFNNEITCDLVIPASVAEIGIEAFRNFHTTGNLFLSEGLETIRSFAFRYSTFTGELVIPEGVKTIDREAFHNCHYFVKLTLPTTLISIGEEAFLGCSGFTGELVIPEGITHISYCAFSGCSGFSGLVLPNTITEIQQSAFQGCGFVGNLVIPESVESIQNGAFSGCSGFTGELTLPTNLQEIGPYAFYGCSGFTGSVTIPENVTTIEECAFSDCTGLDAAIFTGPAPSEIGIYVFRRCASGFKVYCMCDYLESFTSHDTYDASNGCTWAGYPLEILDDPDEKSGHCGENLTWTLYRNGTLRISGTGSMYNYEYHEAPWYLFRYSLKSLELENGISRSGTYAFTDSTKLTGDLILPDSLLSIGDYAFSGCWFTGSLEIPNNVTVIGNEAFSGCGGFNGSLVISDTLSLIGQAAFRDCDGLIGNISFPESLLRIRDKAFYNCVGVTGATFNGNVPMMGENVFDNCADEYTVYCYQEFASSYTTVDGKWNGYPLKIIDAQVTPEITLSLTGATLDVGSKVQLAAALTSDAGETSIVWTSSDITVASVEEGTVTALAEGTTVITASLKDGGSPVAFEVKVNQAPALIIRGDIDGDGMITAKDRMILSRYLAGWQEYALYFEK